MAPVTTTDNQIIEIPDSLVDDAIEKTLIEWREVEKTAIVGRGKKPKRLFTRGFTANDFLEAMQDIFGWEPDKSKEPNKGKGTAAGSGPPRRRPQRERRLSADDKFDWIFEFLRALGASRHHAMYRRLREAKKVADEAIS